MREARSRDERIRRGDLAGAAGDAQALADGVDAVARRTAQLRTAIAAVASERDRLLAHGATAATIAHFERYLRRLRHDLDAAAGELLRAAARHRGQLEAVDAARDRLTLARAEREVIERHFAAWRAERRKLVERRED
jgi:hypothetical protein